MPSGFPALNVTQAQICLLGLRNANKTKKMETKKTYYFNAVNGVTPADHDIAYNINWCDGEGGNYNIASARLEINNAKSYGEYLEDISGHYVEGVKMKLTNTSLTLSKLCSLNSDQRDMGWMQKSVSCPPTSAKTTATVQ